ncbi:ferric reductase-like transmembrane domain-containing protein [Aestuariivirga sp.]|uniref:ferric reductase-like transmembrane domain-containing protein n=1 Tax=Aestuariivirga sp. TaxID=2650926 RepID=UPI003BA86A3B
MFGVGTFLWAGVHLALYLASVKFDLVFSGSEIIHRAYLTIGFAALSGLAVLASTSTDTSISRLGRWWKRLHRWTYRIAALAILHFFMQSKIDTSEATLMAGLFLTPMLSSWTATNSLFCSMRASRVLISSMNEFGVK